MVKWEYSGQGTTVTPALNIFILELIVHVKNKTFVVLKAAFGWLLPTAEPFS